MYLWQGTEGPGRLQNPRLQGYKDPLGQVVRAHDQLEYCDTTVCACVLCVMFWKANDLPLFSLFFI